MYNLSFRLEYVYWNGADITCPQCKQSYDLDWDTEYGDPITGQHEAKCDKCGHEFTFTMTHSYTQP